jgi:hypothetical protein
MLFGLHPPLPCPISKSPANGAFRREAVQREMLVVGWLPFPIVNSGERTPFRRILPKVKTPCRPPRSAGADQEQPQRIAASPEEKIDQRENDHRSDNYNHRRPNAGSSDVLSSKVIFVR